MDLAEGALRFRRAMTHCDNLVDVHRGYGGPAQGRRSKEVSVNRAVVVVTVAAWQAAVQDMVLAAIEAGIPGPDSLLTQQTYSIVAGRARGNVGGFNTPNPENTRQLLLEVGFDPRPFWTWSQMGGQGVGVLTLTPHDVEQRMREWLRLRHDIAHGNDSLSRVNVLLTVREKVNPPDDWQPTIRLVDAEACMAFFRRVADLTAAGLAEHLGHERSRWDLKQVEI
jgi:hypothetical protein